MRDNDVVADSLGKNLLSLRTAMLVLGGAIAGLSGGILVTYITTWSPAAWGYAETVVLFAAVIIGGAGNHRGAVLGAILVPVGFEEVTRFIPTSNNLPPNLIPSLEWVAIGLLIVIFLWLRPQGILPERKRVIRTVPVGDGAPAGGGTAGWQRHRAATVVPERARSPVTVGTRRAAAPPPPVTWLHRGADGRPVPRRHATARTADLTSPPHGPGPRPAPRAADVALAPAASTSPQPCGLRRLPAGSCWRGGAGGGGGFAGVWGGAGGCMMCRSRCGRGR